MVTTPSPPTSTAPDAFSSMLQVREVAMMSIMEDLADKEDWQTQVFDEGIVSKWRTETLAISDEQFNQLARRDKLQSWDADGNLSVGDDKLCWWAKPLIGIVTENTFDCVCSLLYVLGYILILELESASKNSEAKLSTMKNPTLYPPSMHVRL
jgi:Domain of unknown function DUF4246, N-terminal